MASLNDYSNNAKIICPYFEMQYKSSIRCCGFLEGQTTTRLGFENPEKKTEHVNNFCLCPCWQGCPLAKLIEEGIENET